MLRKLNEENQGLILILAAIAIIGMVIFGIMAVLIIDMITKNFIWIALGIAIVIGVTIFSKGQYFTKTGKEYGKNEEGRQ